MTQDDSRDKDKKAEAKKFIKPLKFAKPEISRDGSMTINFNQKIKVPSFLSQKRILSADSKIALEDLDVTRDVLDLTFLLNSDINPKDI